MSESTRGYKVAVALLIAALVVAVGFILTRTSTPDEENMKKLNALAGQLEDCKKGRQELQDRLAQMEADLKRAQEQASAPNVINGGSVQAKVVDGRGPALPLDQVQKIIRQNTGGLKNCYERALKRDSGLQVSPIRVTFRFYIHPTGQTGEASLSTDTHIDQQLVECFKQAIGRWRFPSFGGQPMPIELPLPFQPVASK